MEELDISGEFITFMRDGDQPFRYSESVITGHSFARRDALKTKTKTLEAPRQRKQATGSI